jgi:hypothetical protein
MFLNSNVTIVVIFMSMKGSLSSPASLLIVKNVKSNFPVVFAVKKVCVYLWLIFSIVSFSNLSCTLHIALHMVAMVTRHLSMVTCLSLL